MSSTVFLKNINLLRPTLYRSVRQYSNLCFLKSNRPIYLSSLKIRTFKSNNDSRRANKNRNENKGFFSSILSKNKDLKNENDPLNKVWSDMHFDPLSFKYFQRGKFESQEFMRNLPKGTDQYKNGFNKVVGIAYKSIFILYIVGIVVVSFMANAILHKARSMVEIDFESGEGGTNSSHNEGGLSSLINAMQTEQPVERPSTRFSDIKGMSEIMEQLQQVSEIFSDREKFTDMGLKPPKGILLSGPPGCGKTLIGKALAGEVNVPFYFIAAAQVNGKYVGQGAKKIAAIFEQAKKHEEGAIIFFDELDAIGGKRGDSINPFSRLTINKLLNEMDGFDTDSKILVVGSTNFKKVLDPALTRSGRFDMKLDIPYPNKKDREELMNYYLAKVVSSPGVDVQSYATMLPGTVGADFKNIVNTAAQITVQKKKEMVDDLDIIDSIKRVFLGTEQKERFKDIPEIDLKVAAYKQAAHAIIALKLKDRRKILYLTIMPRNGKVGIIKFQNLSHEDNVRKSDHIRNIKANIATKLADDRITKEIFGLPNSSDNNTNDNIEAARNLLSQMVGQWGMGEGDAQIMFHTDLKHCSEHLKNLVTNEAERLFKIYEAEVLSDRELYWKDIDFVAKALLHYNTLSGSEINKLLEKRCLNCVKESRDQAAKEVQFKAAERIKHLMVDMGRVEDDKEGDGSEK